MAGLQFSTEWWKLNLCNWNTKPTEAWHEVQHVLLFYRAGLKFWSDNDFIVFSELTSWQEKSLLTEHVGRRVGSDYLTENSLSTCHLLNFHDWRLLGIQTIELIWFFYWHSIENWIDSNYWRYWTVRVYRVAGTFPQCLCSVVREL